MRIAYVLAATASLAMAGCAPTTSVEPRTTAEAEALSLFVNGCIATKAGPAAADRFRRAGLEQRQRVPNGVAFASPDDRTTALLGPLETPLRSGRTCEVASADVTSRRGATLLLAAAGSAFPGQNLTVAVTPEPIGVIEVSASGTTDQVEVLTTRLVPQDAATRTSGVVLSYFVGR